MDGTSHRLRARLERAGPPEPSHMLPARRPDRPLRAEAELPAPDWADSLFLRESLRLRLSRRREAIEPYSLAWFEAVERMRHAKQGAWMPRLLGFAKHAGDTLLGLGDGLGTDWLQYAKHGVAVTACCATPEQLALVRRNFELRRLPGRFVQAEATTLPVEDESVDVVYANGLPTMLEQDAADEIFRVLRPGGKVLALLPARRNALWWQHLLLPWNRLFLRPPPALVEPRRYTAEQARRLFGLFAPPRIHKRHLCRSELPGLWRGLPSSLLEPVMGRFLILKAFKPLRVTIPALRAA